MKPGRIVLPLTSITCASAGIGTSPRRPTAKNLPASITMTESSMGGPPVPSISFPPCTTSTFSAMFFFSSCFPLPNLRDSRSLQYRFLDAFNGLDRQDRHHLELLHDLIFMSQLQIFSSGRAFQTTLRAAP